MITDKAPSGTQFSSPEEAMVHVGRLLGVSKSQFASEKSEVNCRTGIVFDALMSDLQISCPSLSLLHEEHLSHKDRKQTEDYAVALLSRPLELQRELSAPQTGYSDHAEGKHQLAGIFEVSSASDMGEQILRNTCGSFSMLLNSRLRACLSILAKHGIANAISADVESIEQKLENLLSVGLGLETMQSSSAWDVSDVQGVSLGNQKLLPVELSVNLELSIPSRSDPVTVPVSFTATGDMAATIDADGDATSIKISLDTRALLSEMVEKAADVVSSVVSMASKERCIPEPLRKANRGDSYLMMPPPPPKRKNRMSRKPAQNALDLLSIAAVDARVVSPDMRALAAETNSVPLLTLEVSAPPKDVTEMSADECANIVDGVLDCLDDDFLTMGPPTKRPKTSI